MTTWQDPPTKAGRRAKYVTSEVVAELRANPGRWLLLDDHTRKAATAVRNWAVRHPGFEHTTRSVGEVFDIYVRFTSDAF